MKMPMLLSFVLLAAVPVAAQVPGPQPPMAMPMMGMMQEMMGPMHRSMAFNPAGLLERAEVLGLTQQQSTRLTQIRDAVKAAHDAAHNDAMQHGTALGKALAAPAPDTAQVRAHFAGHHDAMGRAHLVMLQASIQAKAVLTEAQRARVEGWADAMEMHQRMGQGAGMGMPMHQHQGQQRP